MEGFKRAGAGALLTVAVLAAAPAAHAAGVGVTEISSLPAGAKAGNLTGVVTNESDRAARAEVSVRVMRRKTGGALIGKTSVDVAAHGTKTFLVGVKVPSLKKGTYYVAACTPQGGADKGALGCATSAADLKIEGGDPVRGKLAQRQFEAQGKARAAQAAVHARRSHARQAGRPRVARARQRRLPEPPQRRLHQLRRRHQQVPAGHARRADAEVDAVPERVQPGLRSPEQHLEPRRPCRART